MSRPARYAKGLAKHEEILTTALEVIASTGYRGTSIREIATAVGLSQAGLLHYFASKEELFAEILAKRDAVNEAAFADRGESALDGLISTVGHNPDVPGLVQLYAQFSVEAGDSAHPAHDRFAQRYARVRNELAEDLVARQEAGTMPPGLDADAISRLLVAASDGLQIMWLFDPEVDMAADLAALLSLLGSAPAPTPR